MVDWFMRIKKNIYSYIHYTYYLSFNEVVCYLFNYVKFYLFFDDIFSFYNKF